MMTPKERKPKAKERINITTLATQKPPNVKYESPYKDMNKQVKSMIKDLNKVSKISDDQIENLLTGIALGVVKDAFGLDVSVDTRIKAIVELGKLRERKEDKTTANVEAVTIIDDISNEVSENES